jgi:hypothetical protein
MTSINGRGMSPGKRNKGATRAFGLRAGAAILERQAAMRAAGDVAAEAATPATSTPAVAQRHLQPLSERLGKTGSVTVWWTRGCVQIAYND